MVFSSPIFLFLFLPLVLTLYLFMPPGLRNLFLLLASLIFYAWGEGLFVLLLLVSIGMHYTTGLLLDHIHNRTVRKLILKIAVTLNLGWLVAFKYANFLVDNLNALLDTMHIVPLHLSPVHLPIGISFFTFQALSYIIDIYRGQTPAQKNPIHLALYISSFPQLIAGPIVRYHDIAHQLVKRSVTLDGFGTGCRRFIVGLAKKVLIANPLGNVAEHIFLLPDEHLTGGLAWLGVTCYTLQIYFDFSGYSDMAIGLGRMFGFRFLENFHFPYISRSIQEFWRRWHISLSTWFRDYLYIPLGGNRHKPVRVYANLITVFFLCGLWHGASWNFVIWGLLHGFFLLCEHMGFRHWLERMASPIRHLYVLLVVMVGWVFFRTEDIPSALRFLQALAGFGHGTGIEHNVALYLNTEVLLAMVAGIIASTPVVARFEYVGQSETTESIPLPNGRHNVPLGLAARSVLTTIVLSLLMLLSTMSLAAGTYNPFIYFRF